MGIAASDFHPSALRIRLFSSPFIFSDEGLSFGGSCPGFDASGCPGQKVGDTKYQGLPSYLPLILPGSTVRLFQVGESHLWQLYSGIRATGHF